MRARLNTHEESLSSPINFFSYREIQVAPYLVIYQVNKAAREVSIHVVADGRRNFTELLRERLLMPPVSG